MALDKNRTYGRFSAAGKTNNPVQPLSAIEPTRLYRQIADVILQNIDEGAFPIGSLLPAERVLAQQLSVSRTSVREALIALEVTGNVSVRVGHGVLVLATSIDRPAGSVSKTQDLTSVDDHPVRDDVGPIQLMQARRYIESETALLAAASRSQADLDRIQNTLKGSLTRQADDFLNYRDNDRAFHIAIAQASGNSAYPVIVEHLWDYCYQPLFRKFEELFGTAGRITSTAVSHQAIFDAIEARDPDGARMEMQRHIDSVRHAFSRELEAD